MVITDASARKDVPEKGPMKRRTFDIARLDELRQLISYDPVSGAFSWLAGGRSYKFRLPGTTNTNGYRVIQVMGKIFFAHRLAHLLMTGRMPGPHMDHINGCRSDNRWSNLRECSAKLNMQNLRSAKSSNQTSRLLGAYPCTRGHRWRAQIRVGGNIVHLGYFDTAQEAHCAYVAAKRVHHEGCTI